ncbi:MAG: cation transporter [Sporolactobacillus sp.]
MNSKYNNVNPVKTGIHIEIFSIVWMLTEFSIAVYSGVSAHSLLLVAFGVDSLIEFISGSVLIWRLNVEYQNFGREKIEHAERISSLVVGVALLLLAAYVVITSIFNLITHHSAETSILGIALAIGSCVIMPLLMAEKRRIARTMGSKALAEDGMCNLVCAYMAFTVLIGAGLTALFNWWWADSAAALILVYFIVSEGLETLHSEDE